MLNSSLDVVRLINTMGCPSPSRSCPIPSPCSPCIREISVRASQKWSSCWNNCICIKLTHLLKSLANIKQRQRGMLRHPSASDRAHTKQKTVLTASLSVSHVFLPPFIFQSARWSRILFACRSVSDTLPVRASQAAAGETQRHEQAAAHFEATGPGDKGSSLIRLHVPQHRPSVPAQLAELLRLHHGTSRWSVCTG